MPAHRIHLIRYCQHCGDRIKRSDQLKFCSRKCSNPYKKGGVLLDKDFKFWRRIPAKRPADKCWPWQGTLSTLGYGQFTHGKGVIIAAHRYSYEIHHGDIPTGLFVCHSCDRPDCVNPKHLFVGTTQDNTADMVAKERNVWGERHHSSKLTREQVLDIRRTYVKGGVGMPTIARRYGVNTATIYHIVHRKTWKRI